MGMWSTGWPPINSFIDMLYGTAGVDYGGWCCSIFSGASGLVFSGNPPFTVTDFGAMYPKFLGPPTIITDGLTISVGSNLVSGFTLDTLYTVAPGQLIVSALFPKDTVIVEASAEDQELTLSNVATGNGNSTIGYGAGGYGSGISGTPSSFTIYTAPYMPIVVILMYVNLALACVMQARFQEMWAFCVCLFVAHYCTLYMRTESGPNLTASQVASSGLTKGIAISRHAGDVGASSQLLITAGYQEWGAWNETQYGEQFMTISRAINCGPIFVS
jgi:hypothetical protein